MRIQRTLSNDEAEQDLNEHFGFTEEGQDWDIANADDTRLEEFIAYFHETEDTDRMLSMSNLIIASIDILEEEEERDQYLYKIQHKIFEHRDIFLNTIIFWSVLGAGEDEDEIFAVSLSIRRMLNNLVDPVAFEIRSPIIDRIMLGELSLESVLSEKDEVMPFDELITQLDKAGRIYLSDEETLEIEILVDVVFWNIYGLEEDYLFKFNREEYMRNIKNFKPR